MASKYLSPTGRRLPPRSATGQFRERRSKGAMLLWNGVEVVEEVGGVMALWVKDRADVAADYARQNHPWKNRTGHTEASIWSGTVRIDGPIIRCDWGCASPGIFLEFGTTQMGTTRMPAYPFLRPAADHAYGRFDPAVLP